MAHLLLGVLGCLQVSTDDVPVAWFESDKVRALLVYLAVEADRPHRRESLVGLFWPDHPEQVALHNLRQALFNLRQAIGDHTASPPFLLISRESIQFNRASDFSLDVARFVTILRTCEEERHRGVENPSIRAARLEELVKLYRGEFLEGFLLDSSVGFEQWALVQRESLHQQAVDAYSWLARYYEEHGDFPSARRHALRELELDPWREEAHGQLMRALALEGQRAAALAQFETCRRVLAEELGVEPSSETRELAERIRTGTLTPQNRAPPSLPSTTLHSLPVPLTSFHGRERELADLDRLIADAECRCISLVGPGGIGKTRLAVHATEQFGSSFAHGVAFASLASVVSVEAAIAAIAGAIHFAFYGPNDPKDQLLSHLSGKQILLILDNVEQLLTQDRCQRGFEDLVLEILERAPGVKLLVTSRQLLDLQEEWVLDVEGLAVPDPGQTDGLADYAAVALFLQRARRASPGFAPDAADLAAVANICRLVEGTPLAIELAATWSRILSPAEIAHEIETSLNLLSTSVRALPERHRSMHAVFNQTWQTLSAEEQQALLELSVFRGGFTRQAAEQVANASLAVLSALVNRTLLRRASAGRYELHELVRQYSAMRLAAHPSAHAAAHKSHYEYCLQLAKASEQGLRERTQSEWLQRLEQEHDNVRAALAWALETDRAAPDGSEWALQLSGAMRLFWRMRGHFVEGRTWLTRSLRQYPEGRTRDRADVLLGESTFAYTLGDLDAARRSAEESAAICRELGEQRALAEALTLLGLTWIWQGQAIVVQARFEEALAIYRHVGDRWGEAQALRWLGTYQADSFGDPAGRAMLEQSVAILEDLEDKHVLTVALTSLGIADSGMGEYETARTRFERGLALAREIDHPWGVANALANLGSVHRILGAYSDAHAQLEEALQVYHHLGCGIWEADVGCRLAENALCQGDLGTARTHLLKVTRLIGNSENLWLKTLVSYFGGLLAYHEGDALTAARLLTETTALAREGHFGAQLARALVALGRVECALGQLTAASEVLFEGLELSRELGDRLNSANAIEQLGAMHASQGDSRRAVMLLGAAHALRQMLGVPLSPVDRAAHDAVMATCRTQLGAVEFANAWAHAAGRQVDTVAEVILQGR